MVPPLRFGTLQPIQLVQLTGRTVPRPQPVEASTEFQFVDNSRKPFGEILFGPPEALFNPDSQFRLGQPKGMAASVVSASTYGHPDAFTPQTPETYAQPLAIYNGPRDRDGSLYREMLRVIRESASNQDWQRLKSLLPGHINQVLRGQKRLRISETVADGFVRQMEQVMDNQTYRPEEKAYMLARGYARFFVWVHRQNHRILTQPLTFQFRVEDHVPHDQNAPRPRVVDKVIEIINRATRF